MKLPSIFATGQEAVCQCQCPQKYINAVIAVTDVFRRYSRWSIVGHLIRKLTAAASILLKYVSLFF